MRKRLWWSYILILIIAMIPAGPAGAAAREGITLTPAGINVVVEPGSLNKGSFQVLNQGGSGYDFHLYVKPYHVDGEDYTPDFTLLPGTTDISDWFQFTALHGHADPGQALDIGYQIVVPPHATPGGYYAVAFAETDPPPTADRIQINERVGELFYVQVAGATTEKSDVASWQVGAWQKPPLVATLRLENAGTVHFYADTTLNVRDIFGRIKYTSTTHKVILPRTIRKIGLTWDKAPPIGLFKVDGTTTFLGQKHNLGSHYILIMSNNARRIVTIAFGILVLLTVLSVLRNFLIKRRRKR